MIYGSRKDASLDVHTRAVAAEVALNYDEPDDWFYAVLESLGPALLREIV
jgi:hypothetical protein